VSYPFDGAVYDQIAQRTDDVPFWADLVAHAAGPVLELGVGTGRLALRLAAPGVEYHGVDVEPSMLAALRAKLARSPAAIDLHEGSFLTLALDREFALVFIPANTVSHVLGHDEAVRFFRGVRRHTAAGGRFVIDTFNPRVPEDMGERRVFSRYRDPADGREVVVWTTPHYDHRTQVVTHALEYWKGDVAGQPRELRQRLYYPAELTAWLRWVGFTQVEAYGAYDRSPLTAGSPRLILSAI
jgi:SAM-dependent methyltransferase